MKIREMTLLFTGFLVSVPMPANATESVDCWGDVFSVQVVCGEDCLNLNFFVGSSMQEGVSWEVDRDSLVDLDNKVLSLRAKGTSTNFETLSLMARGTEGSLVIGRGTYSVKCDWSAFEP